MTTKEKAALAAEQNAKQRAEWRAASINIPETLGGGRIYRIEDTQWVVERKNHVLYYPDIVWCLRDVLRYAVGNGTEVRTLREILERVKQIDSQILTIAKEKYQNDTV